MTVETSAPPGTDALADRARRAVADLAQRLALEPGAVPADEGPGGGGAPADETWTDPLASLRALAVLSRAVDECAAAAARAAADGGAGYPQLGSAWGVSRQGARKRWPGLVFTARPSSRPLPNDLRSPHMNGLAPRRSYTVLLVEDDVADAMLIEEALIERGMAREINRVDDGVSALEYLRDPANDRPDLIVLDLNMPRMNGRELLSVLKNDEQLSSIPIVVLTTSAAPDDVQDAYTQHANAYVTKPVNLDDFVRTVQSIDSFFLETAVTPQQPPHGS
ncbi:response regulator [Streptomyces sp. NBC_01218]|uniref:response regulator n=1 Tax=unclassified Streptomyces TaxID=2593676 RepID=UPI0023B9E144|nr:MULTISPECIES: response regulator [unclassified Streptomyces]WEH41762.1 response regulator [Streptomyces sp. AM 2-1-1]WSQ53383.1 response regulator [Streptomyces sp. NBC_01218]